MSKISSGILGGFSGKVGNVVGAKWKGIDTMKIKPSKVSNPKTLGQLDQRTRFSTALGFLKPLTDFLKVGFRHYAKRMSAFNAAMSYTLLNAITGSYPNYSIDYSVALVSRGTLTSGSGAAVASSAAGSLTLTWTDNSGNGSALSSDIAMIVAFNPTRSEAVSMMAGPQRSTETAAVTVPNDFSGQTVYVYLAFINAEGSKVSNSIYCGSVVVS
jgi:hypothetical protein